MYTIHTKGQKQPLLEAGLVLNTWKRSQQEAQDSL